MEAFRNPNKLQIVFKEKQACAPCGCFLCSKVPDHPKNIPFVPTEENRDKLDKWILSHLESSAFNTCTHQPPQTMTGKQLDITFELDAKSHAVHCPIPVPITGRRQPRRGWIVM